MDKANMITLDAYFDEDRFAALMREALDKCFSIGKPVDNDLHYDTHYDPHNVAEAMCWKCGARWIAVHPSATLLKELECPGCHNAGYAFLTGQDIVEDD